jgi:hypothetical protein
MSKLILYHTEHCHLCDEAEALILAAGQREGQSGGYQKVEIENDPELLKRYEIHIPVLKRTDNQQELFWPFGTLELAAFMGTDK